MKRAAKILKMTGFSINSIFTTVFLIMIIISGCSDDNNSTDDQGDYPYLNPVGQYAFNGYALDIKIKDATVFVVNGGYMPGEGGVYAIDVSDPLNPILTDKYTDSKQPLAMDINEDYAYILSMDNTGTEFLYEIQKIDITNIPFIKTDTLHSIPGSPNGISINEGYLYLANSELGFQVIDIADFDSVDATISLSVTGQPSIVKTSGDLAFVAGYQVLLELVDISNPIAPVQIGSLSNPYAITPHDIAVTENYAALPCGGEGVLFVNIENPADPEVILSSETGDWAEDITFSGNYAFLADGDTGVVIGDVTDPLNYIIKGICMTNGYAKKVAVSGNYVFVAVNDQGLLIFDINDLP